MICVDPGHGMSNRRWGVYDPGAVWEEDGQRFEEAAIALQYGLALRDALRGVGHAVFMTRDDALDHAPVGQRAANARALGAQAFVSLHLNSAGKPDGSVDDAAHGVETLVRDAGGVAFARTLNAAVVGATRLGDRGVRERQDLAVLGFAGPVALLELGFLPNDRDRHTLLNPAIRHAVAQALAQAIAGFVPAPR